MAIANYSTKVPVARTIESINRLLAKAGARSVLVDYDQEQEVSAVSFQISVGAELIAYRLPANLAGVATALEDAGLSASYLRPEHVRRVAWRIIHDWLRAQLALIEAQQASLHAVMLPYAITASGTTVAQELEARGARYLLG